MLRLTSLLLIWTVFGNATAAAQDPQDPPEEGIRVDAAICSFQQPSGWSYEETGKGWGMAVSAGPEVGPDASAPPLFRLASTLSLHDLADLTRQVTEMEAEDLAEHGWLLEEEATAVERRIDGDLRQGLVYRCALQEDSSKIGSMTLYSWRKGDAVIFLRTFRAGAESDPAVDACLDSLIAPGLGVNTQRSIGTEDLRFFFPASWQGMQQGMVEKASYFVIQAPSGTIDLLVSPKVPIDAEVQTEMTAFEQASVTRLQKMEDSGLRKVVARRSTWIPFGERVILGTVIVMRENDGLEVPLTQVIFPTSNRRAVLMEARPKPGQEEAMYEALVKLAQYDVRHVAESKAPTQTLSLPGFQTVVPSVLHEGRVPAEELNGMEGVVLGNELEGPRMWLYSHAGEIDLDRDLDPLLGRLRSTQLKGASFLGSQSFSVRHGEADTEFTGPMLAFETKSGRPVTLTVLPIIFPQRTLIGILLVGLEHRMGPVLVLSAALENCEQIKE